MDFSAAELRYIAFLLNTVSLQFFPFTHHNNLSPFEFGRRFPFRFLTLSFGFHLSTFDFFHNSLPHYDSCPSYQLHHGLLFAFSHSFTFLTPQFFRRFERAFENPLSRLFAFPDPHPDVELIRLIQLIKFHPRYPQRIPLSNFYGKDKDVSQDLKLGTYSWSPGHSETMHAH